jgi:putative ATP-dependent endonuclease of OLD family
MLNPKLNIFVGENDSGKSTILEVLSIITTGRLHFYPFDQQIKANLFNNDIRATYIEKIQAGKTPKPPKMIFEAYLDDSVDQKLRGSNNELRENSAGIRVVVEMDSSYADIYKQMLDEKAVFDIPVELYKVTYHYFSSEDDKVLFRFSPVKSVFIDASHKDYSYMVNKFVNTSIEEVLSRQEQIDLSREYRSNRNKFKLNKNVKKLNKTVSERNKFDSSRKVTVDLQEESVDAWKKQMTVLVEDIPFENVGFGTQNTIKAELAIKNSSEQVNIVLMEEPENNLSFTNMSKLIDDIEATEGKQIFIATHSSYVANKLDLKNLFLVNQGIVKPFSSLNETVIDYFKKLPGYDTLRVVLAEKVILVEGPTDELILQRAYKDLHKKLPIKDGIDIIVVDSLAFKRYCEIAVLIGKKISVVTDNDKHPEEIKERYKEFINNPLTTFFYDTNPELNTIEPSVLDANCIKGVPNLEFQKIVNLKNKEQMTFDELNKFMKNNKSLWAMRVFDAEKTIKYPRYIIDAVKQFD